jgi:hypothetical protein
MADALTTITKLIQSMPGVLVAGAALAGIVWKFFERAESVLNEGTRLEIAIWLLGRKKFGPKVQPWSDTFARVFDRVFGEKHLSWKCFGRSCIASYASVGILLSVAVLIGLEPLKTLGFINETEFRISESVVVVALLYGLFFNVIPDYLSLLETRYVLNRLKATRSILAVAVWLVIDLYITSVIATLTCLLGLDTLALAEAKRQFGSSVIVHHDLLDDVLFALFRSFHPLHRYRLSVVLWYFPAFFTSIWLWLYAGSGFLLKAARRFDIGFDWFNRRFDIEKKPLQSIGLVAGALVALVYWLAVIVSRVVG